MDKNLFGEEIHVELHELEILLREWDNATFDARLVRTKYVNEIYPEGHSFMATIEVFYLMIEAKTTFINGQFASTILLSQSFIEHWLHSQLTSNYNLPKRAGLNDILICLRANNLLHPFLIQKIDRLRQIRNPFVHVRSLEDPDRLDHRAFADRKAPDDLLEEDAREALSIMYQVAISNL